MARVLIVEDTVELAELLQSLLVEEGYQVATLANVEAAATRRAVAQFAPDCVVLDSSGHAEYGESWTIAAWLRHRARPVPTVMLTAHLTAVREAQSGVTERSRAAAFFAAIAKPFDLDEVLTAVGRAVAQPPVWEFVALQHDVAEVEQELEP